MEIQQKDMTLYRSKTILISFIISSLLIGWAVNSLFQNTNNLSEHTGILASGIIILFLCTVIFIRSLYQLFFRKPILIISTGGLFTPKRGSISWNDIEKIGVKSSSIIPDTWEKNIYIMSVPLIWIYLKTGKKFRLNRSFYSVDPIDILNVLQLYKPVITIKNSANLFK